VPQTPLLLGGLVAAKAGAALSTISTTIAATINNIKDTRFIISILLFRAAPNRGALIPEGETL
jgi:hypothetical protein